METLDSPVNVRHGGVPLAVIGVAMFRLARVSGGQDVEVQTRVRSGSARPVPRGNERHVIEFELGAEADDIEAAAKAAAAWPDSLPRGRDFATVTTADDSGIRLHEAVVEAWPTDQEASIGRHGARITGGKLEAWTIPPPEPDFTFDGASGLIHRLRQDDVAEWFEIGFLAPSNDLLGSASDGWTDVGGNLLFRPERSEDLTAWDHDFIDAPGSPEGPDGNGDYTYWARSIHPRIWKYVTIDLTLASDRHSKSITALKLFGATIPLPGYPYSMPAQASALQSDLLAAGFTGATVSSVSHPMTVVVKNHTNTGDQVFDVTLSGSNVTAVKNASGSTIPLAYPYAMPSQATTLRSALVSAGYPYASVRVFGDEWTIFIPDRATVFNQRDFSASITPADPYTYQGLTGTGTDAGSLLFGSAVNLRATTGLTPLEEAPRQFARMAVSPGPNYQFD